MNTNQEKCRYWHSIFGHASERDLLNIVDQKLVDGLPEFLTPAFIRKNFVHDCDHCVAATMSQKPLPSSSKTTHPLLSHCKCSMDIMYGPRNTVAYGVHKYALVAKDHGSDMSWVYLLDKLDDLHEYVQKNSVEYSRTKRTLSIIGIDSSFVTEATKAMLSLLRHDYEDSACIRLDDIDPTISIHQPAPHEHAQNGHAESLVKYLRQSSNKCITASASHRSFWGYAVLHVNRICCLMSSALNRSKSRAEIWNGVRTNVHISPVLIFGSQVMAHIPLSLQRTHGKASPHAIPEIYIDEAPGVKGGILLFNTGTKRTFIRRTFKVIGFRSRKSIPISPMMDIAVYPEAEIDRFIYNDNYHRSLVLSDLISPAVDAIAPLPPTFEPAVSDSYIFIPESEASDSSRRFYGKNWYGICRL